MVVVGALRLREYNTTLPFKVAVFLRNLSVHICSVSDTFRALPNKVVLSAQFLESVWLAFLSTIHSFFLINPYNLISLAWRCLLCIKWCERFSRRYLLKYAFVLDHIVSKLSGRGVSLYHTFNWLSFVSIFGDIYLSRVFFWVNFSLRTLLIDCPHYHVLKFSNRVVSLNCNCFPCLWRTSKCLAHLNKIRASIHWSLWASRF